MDPSPIANGLATNPLAWMCAVLLVAVGVMFKMLISAYQAQLDRADKAKAEHLATIEKIIPVAEKLTSAVEILEKLSLREGQG